MLDLVRRTSGLAARSASISVGLLVGLLGGLLPAAHAQDAFPTKPIKIVVGYTPGGSADATARLLAQGMTTRLGQTVIVENQPGASGNIAGGAVSHSPPDGYTLFLGSNATAINMTLYRKLTFQLDKDLAPVGLVSSFPNMLLVTPKFPARSVPEFIAYLKANPDKANMASTGNGASSHLVGELFNTVAGVKMSHVRYKGSAPAQTDLMSGQVDVMFDNVPSALGLVKSGKLRALAITSPTRQPYAPDLPTMAELGLPALQVKSWYGLLAPRDTPAAVIRKLNATINAVLADPETNKRFAELGCTTDPTTPEAFGVFIKAEIAKWGEVVRRSGATLD